MSETYLVVGYSRRRGSKNLGEPVVGSQEYF